MKPVKDILKPLFAGFALLGAILTVGCSSVTPVGQVAHEAVPVDRVEVLYQEPQRAYEVIALVSYQGTIFATVPGVVEECRKAAARAGADAVIITATVRSYASASGKAIRWK